jgi:hypothetical protein
MGRFQLILKKLKIVPAKIAQIRVGCMDGIVLNCNKNSSQFQFSDTKLCSCRNTGKILAGLLMTGITAIHQRCHNPPENR